MPRKTKPKKIPVTIKRIVEERLIDDKILKSSNVAKRSWSRVIAWSAFLGFIVGGGILVYFLSGQNVLKPDAASQIVVPKSSTPQAQPPAQTPVETADEPVEVAVQKVEILDTPIGFLNVRSGPGTNFKKIGQASPGELFDLVSWDKQKGWYEIRLTATSTGWVTGQYARIIDIQ